MRATLGLASDEIVVGTIANYREQKDYPTLLTAAADVIGRGLPVRFVAVGQGPLEEQIHARHVALSLGDRFLLLGHRTDAVQVLAACDVFCLASKWEGLPVALMEALVLGLPVVATAVGGVAEAVDDGGEALLVPSGRPRSSPTRWRGSSPTRHCGWRWPARHPNGAPRSTSHSVDAPDGSPLPGDRAA